MDKIFTSKDRANELGFDSYHALLEYVTNREITHEIDDTDPVYACVDGGRWLARCGGSCKGTGYIDPDEPGFFCTSCLNVETSGKLRSVIWPENKAAIEEELLKREAVMPKGMFGTQGAALASGLPRAWNPGETIEDLIRQREAYGQVTKGDLMTEYLRLQAQMKELEAQLASKEGGNGV